MYIKCPNCGAPLDDEHDGICGYCGTRLNELDNGVIRFNVDPNIKSFKLRSAIDMIAIRDIGLENVNVWVKRDFARQLTEYIIDNSDSIFEYYTDLDPETDRMNYSARIRFLTKDYKFTR